MLLTEAGSFAVELKPMLTESAMVHGADRIFSCPVYPLDTMTGNGRIYPSSEMIPAAQTLTEAIKTGKASFPCTADGHPPEEYPEPVRSSHKMLESWAEGGHLWAKFKVLNTAKGNDLLALIQEGDKLGVSIRGLGALNGSCVTDYTLLGFDFVAIPSTGLKVLPSRSSNVVSESQQLKTDTVYTKEGDKLSNSTSLKELQLSLKESMEEIRSSNKIDRATLLSLAEQSLVKVSNLVCDTKYGVRDLMKLGVEWHNFKESLLQEEVENLDSTKSNEESDKNIDTGAEKAYGAEGAPVNEGDKVTISGEVENVEESQEHVKNLEHGLNLVEESLRLSSQENEVLRKELVGSANKINLLVTSYNNMKNLKESYARDLVKEQLRASQMNTIRESRERYYKSKANDTTRVNAQLVEDNLKLLSANHTLTESSAAYKATAEQLAETNIKLILNSKKA